MARHSLTAITLGALLVFSALPAHSTHSVQAATRAGAEPQWVQWNAGSKTANVTLVAAYNGTNGFFNFDGYATGHLTITVPLGARVVVSFTNKASLPHSAVITPFASHSLPGNFPLAFPGASTPDPAAGAAKVKVPQVFTFTAGKAGQYVIVCGVPGHALGGMWDRLTVADVPIATQQIAETAPPASSGPVIKTGNNLGALAGVVTDASTGKPLAHAMVVLGWTTLTRVGETDATGHYRILNVSPVAAVDAYCFADGYVYYHGHPVAIKRGLVTTYSFQMARSTFPARLLPTLTDATIAPATAKPGATVTFQAHIAPGQQGPLSAENFAVNAILSHSVLLQHVGSDTYRGAWQIPAGTKPGAYMFSFIATMENCLENHPYQHVTLTITQ
jgi:sulfocyanin